jgi:hypothetical protein
VDGDADPEHAERGRLHRAGESKSDSPGMLADFTKLGRAADIMPDVLLNHIELRVTGTPGDRDARGLLDRFHEFYAERISSHQHIFRSWYDTPGGMGILTLGFDYVAGAEYSGPGGSFSSTPPKFVCLHALRDYNNAETFLKKVYRSDNWDEL